MPSEEELRRTFVTASTNTEVRVEALEAYVRRHPEGAKAWLLEKMSAFPTNLADYHRVEKEWGSGLGSVEWVAGKAVKVTYSTVFEIESVKAAGLLLSQAVIVKLLETAQNVGLPYELRAEAVRQLEWYCKTANRKRRRDYVELPGEPLSDTRQVTDPTSGRVYMVLGRTFATEVWPEGLAAIKRGLVARPLALGKQPQLGLPTYQYVDMGALVKSALAELEQYEKRRGLEGPKR